MFSHLEENWEIKICLNFNPFIHYNKKMTFSTRKNDLGFATSKMNYVVKMDVTKPKMEIPTPKMEILQNPTRYTQLKNTLFVVVISSENIK
jgi:hypothetical protein